MSSNLAGSTHPELGNSWQHHGLGFLIRLGGFADLFDVCQVLVASHGELVLDEIVSRDDVGENLPGENFVNTLGPCLIEVHAFDALEDVDP